MRLGIISDVHSFPDRLDTAVSTLDRVGAERLICGGDIVGYGPDPHTTCGMVHALFDEAVQGNHDSFAEPGRPGESGGNLTSAQCRWLHSLPLMAIIGNACFVHASIPAPTRWRYPVVSDGGSSPEDPFVAVSDVFAAMTSQVLFVGHSHVPAVFEQLEDGTVEVHPPVTEGLEIRGGKRYIVDVGSVSLPRMGSPATAVLFDSECSLLRHVVLGR